MQDHAKTTNLGPERLSAKLLGIEKVNMALHMSGVGSRPPLSVSDHIKASSLTSGYTASKIKIWCI